MDDFMEAVPVSVTVVGTPLTFSIATGPSLGSISFTVIKLLTGRRKEISALL
jgi:AGZA family xanthine/uracil permease-like MFS transporter